MAIMMLLYNYRCAFCIFCTAFFAITNCLFNVGLASILGIWIAYGFMVYAAARICQNLIILWWLSTMSVHQPVILNYSESYQLFQNFLVHFLWISLVSEDVYDFLTLTSSWPWTIVSIWCFLAVIGYIDGTCIVAILTWFRHTFRRNV